jgi:hypothetical protein
MIEIFLALKKNHQLVTVVVVVVVTVESPWHEDARGSCDETQNKGEEKGQRLCVVNCKYSLL